MTETRQRSQIPAIGHHKIYQIFVSYSHDDAWLVEKLVQFLQATGMSIFRDEESIKPGKNWAVVISSAIEGSRRVYLFWCLHSARSNEVRKEYDAAIGSKKDIVPILLDETPLPQELAVYQAIDFRDLFGSQHGNQGFWRQLFSRFLPSGGSSRSIRKGATRWIENLERTPGVAPELLAAIAAAGGALAEYEFSTGGPTHRG
jgi:hypothetical protein